MTTEVFMKEVESRFQKIFRASKEGYKATEVERRHLEGFIQAGVFLKLTTNHEVHQLMATIHHNVFGQSIEERKGVKPISWSEEAIDYSRFESPTKFR